MAHSTGGALAFLYALRHPERVGRMVLIEPTLISLLPPDVLAAMNARYAPALAAVERDGPAAFIEMALADILGPGWRSRMSPGAAARLEAQAAIATAHARAFEAMTIRDDDLRALAAPTRFL